MNTLKVLLFPLSILYDGITSVRNFLYETGFLNSFSFRTKTICVGNLRVGGTGKTPFVDFLIKELRHKEFRIAILSRGYGRSNKGFINVDHNSTAKQVGDEPLLYFKKHTNIKVFVDEDRPNGISEIEKKFPLTNLIILDDAFQHRALKADINLVLTEFKRPYFKDYLLPAGRLRESRNGIKRADAIIVTKCPDGITENDKVAFRKSVQSYFVKLIPVFFATVKYKSPVLINGSSEILPDAFSLVSGIDNPAPFINYCSENFIVKREFIFPDHHPFKPEDLDDIIEAGLPVLTTEKDISRFLDIPDWEKFLKIYYIPIEIEILDGNKKLIDFLLKKLE